MLIRPPHMLLSNLRAFFTTKHFLRDDEHVTDAIVREFNISKDSIYLPVQKHTNTIYVLEYEKEQAVADAVITARKNVLIGVLVADCVPILLYDKNLGIIGAVHAGWRGTATNILMETIKIMQEKFGCLLRNILIAIGPSIRQCSYEVDEDVKTAVHNATGEGNYFHKQDKKYFVDLSSANRVQALKAGILSHNIWQSDECTYCMPEKYHSYRYSKGTSGRQGGFIGMW